MYQKNGLCAKLFSVSINKPIVFKPIYCLRYKSYDLFGSSVPIRSRRLLKGIVQTHPQSLVCERKTIKKWPGTIGVMHGLR